MAWGLPRFSDNRELHRPLQNIALWNGLRMMVTMLIPVTIGVIMGQPRYAFMLGLGALVMGISDIPGTNTHRRNGMIVAFFILVLSHGLISITYFLPYLQSVILIILSFLLSYIALYGSRASIIGAAGMLAMIFALFAGKTMTAALMSPVMIAIGAAFYFLVSFTFMQMRPYRIVTQFLGESISGIGEYIRERANLYDINADNDFHLQKLMKKQVLINEEQENIRELLLKRRQVQKGTGHYERALAIIFSESVDMFELAYAAHFDYDKLKEIFRESDILQYYSEIIALTGQEIEALGESIAVNERYELQYDIDNKIKNLNTKLNLLQADLPENVSAGDVQLLFNIHQHLKRLYHKCVLIKEYHNRESKPAAKNFHKLRLDLFTQHQTYAIKPFISNLSWSSIHFKHALRTAITFAAGIGIGLLFPHQKSYWILLTIAVILRPNYSLTLAKANQRVIGTIVGAFIGFGLVSLPFFNNTIGIFILIFAAWGSFTFNVLNYRTSVVFTTIVALLSNYFILPDFISVVEQRILDTLIGAGLSMIALRLLWPDWESSSMADKLTKVLAANRKYIASIKGFLQGQEDAKLQYKLARKDSLTSNSDLSSAFQRMLDNPDRAQFLPTRVYNFTTLNYAFMSHTAGMGSQLMDYEVDNAELAREWIRNIERIESTMNLAEEIILKRHITKEWTIETIPINLEKTKAELKDLAFFEAQRAKEKVLEQRPDSNLINFRTLGNQLDYLESLSKRILRQSEEFGKKLRSQGL